MAYTAAKENGPDNDIQRFACIALHCKDIATGVDWEAAAADFAPDVKPASFKTVTLKALRKATGGEGAAKGGKKRKANGDEGEKKEKPVKKPRVTKKAKAAAQEEEDADGEGEADDEGDGKVKAEAGEYDDAFV